MDAATVVRLVIIGFEVTLALIMIEFMAHAIGKSPARAILAGLEITAFMVLSVLPAPRTPGRHRVVTS